MRKALFILIMALLALSYCGKDKAAAPDDSGKAEGQAAVPVDPADPDAAARQESGGGASAEGEPALRVRSVALSPETPTVADNVTAQPVLADPGLENIGFRYEWYVNEKPVMAINGDTLEKAHFKKGAWIYCRVQAYSENEESEWIKSDAIRVLNSLPVLRMPAMDRITIPGEIFYQAAASDADNDPLTFEVLAPKEQGIVIDPKTGALTWKIDAETVTRLGEKIEIQLAVSDGEGEKVTGTITLNLTSTKQTTPQ